MLVMKVIEFVKMLVMVAKYRIEYGSEATSDVELSPEAEDAMNDVFGGGEYD